MICEVYRRRIERVEALYKADGHVYMNPQLSSANRLQISWPAGFCL